MPFITNRKATRTHLRLIIVTLCIVLMTTVLSFLTCTPFGTNGDERVVGRFEVAGKMLVCGSMSGVAWRVDSYRVMSSQVPRQVDSSELSLVEAIKTIRMVESIRNTLAVQSDADAYIIYQVSAGWPFPLLRGYVLEQNDQVYSTGIRLRKRQAFLRETARTDVDKLSDYPGFMSASLTRHLTQRYICDPVRPIYLNYCVLLAAVFVLCTLANMAMINSKQWYRRYCNSRSKKVARIRGQCPNCGYDLFGEFRSGCPECGWARNRTTSVGAPHPITSPDAAVTPLSGSDGEALRPSAPQ